MDTFTSESLAQNHQQKKTSNGTSTNSLHQNGVVNPTHYRLSSAYIRLFTNIRFTDSKNIKWRFEVKWACSVPVYIQKQLNWRQVHWLLKKVPDSAFESIPQSPSQLLQLFSNDWPEVQRRIDHKLDANYRGEMCIAINRALEQGLIEDIKPGSIVLSYNQRLKSTDIHVDAHYFSETYDCRIWNIERNPFCYRNSLTRANSLGDRRIRLSWSPSVENSLDFWLAKRTDERAIFDAFIATELLTEIDSAGTVKKIKDVLTEGASLVSLECLRRGDVNDAKRLQNATSLLREFFRVESTQHLEMPPSHENEHVEWILIVARRLGNSESKAKQQNDFRRINGGF